MNEEELREELKTQIVTVSFMKANGDSRVMRCTLDPNYIPEWAFLGDYTNNKKYKENIFRVYDLDKKDWRTFKFDRVYDIVYEEELVDPEEIDDFKSIFQDMLSFQEEILQRVMDLSTRSYKKNPR